MKIAIIGSGISGLVAAYHLQRDHAITVFEANDYIGGHTHTVSIQLNGRNFEVDTGFIVFNDRTYPNFIGLLEELGIASQPTEMSFSFSDRSSGLEYNGHNLNTLFAQRANLLRPSFYRMIYDISRFNRIANEVATSKTRVMTVGEFLKQGRYSDEFRNHYLLPMGAAIWSCPAGAFADFPIQFIAEFYKNHGLLDLVNRPTWHVIQGGSKRYVDRLTEGFTSHIRLNAPVHRISRFSDRVEVSTQTACEAFDHVVFACHSDQALKILGDQATGTERELLCQFPYSRNVAILHTDQSLLPRNRRAWASWNYRSEDPDGPPCVTYDMSRLQGLQTPSPVCVTLNAEQQVDPKLVLGRYIYHHPVFTTKRSSAQARHNELTNANRSSFCGAYWRNGFHEDGVVSALAVVKALSEASAMPDRQLRPTSGRVLSPEYST